MGTVSLLSRIAAGPSLPVCHRAPGDLTLWQYIWGKLAKPPNYFSHLEELQLAQSLL